MNTTPSLLIRIRKRLERLEKCLLFIGVGFIGVLMFLTTSDVAGRYVFNHPISGTYELTEYLLIVIVFLSVAYIQSQRGHVTVDILCKRLPRKAFIALTAFGDAMGLFVLAVVFWQSGLIAWRAWRIGEYAAGLIPFPLWPARLMFSFGIFILCMRLLLDLVSSLTDLVGVNSSGYAQTQKENKR